MERKEGTSSPGWARNQSTLQKSNNRVCEIDDLASRDPPGRVRRREQL